MRVHVVRLLLTIAVHARHADHRTVAAVLALRVLNPWFNPFRHLGSHFAANMELAEDIYTLGWDVQVAELVSEAGDTGGELQRIMCETARIAPCEMAQRTNAGLERLGLKEEAA